MQPPNPEYPPAQQPTQPPYYQPTQQPYNGQHTPVPPPPYQHNTYPPQMPPMQPKKSRTWIWIIGLILAFLVGRASVTTASSTAATPQTNAASTTNQQAAAQPTQAQSTAHHKIGETVSVDNTWAITVDSVTTSQGDTINVPKSGNTFLMVTMTFKNISSQQQAVSSLLGLTLRGPDGTNYQQALYTGGQGMPDGNVAAGAVTKGVVSFEVPTSTHNFTLNYSDLGGQVQTWDLIA